MAGRSGRKFIIEFVAPMVEKIDSLWTTEGRYTNRNDNDKTSTHRTSARRDVVIARDGCAICFERSASSVPVRLPNRPAVALPIEPLRSSESGEALGGAQRELG